MTILGLILIILGSVWGLSFLTQLALVVRAGRGTVNVIPAYIAATCIAAGVFLVR